MKTGQQKEIVATTSASSENKKVGLFVVHCDRRLYSSIFYIELLV
jgi:hypothetical protein